MMTIIQEMEIRLSNAATDVKSYLSCVFFVRVVSLVSATLLSDSVLQC